MVLSQQGAEADHLAYPAAPRAMRAEEALLRTHFGGEYDAYCTRTSRLIPGLY